MFASRGRPKSRRLLERNEFVLTHPCLVVCVFYGTACVLWIRLLITISGRYLGPHPASENTPFPTGSIEFYASLIIQSHGLSVDSLQDCVVI